MAPPAAAYYLHGDRRFTARVITGDAYNQSRGVDRDRSGEHVVRRERPAAISALSLLFGAAGAAALALQSLHQRAGSLPPAPRRLRSAVPRDDAAKLWPTELLAALAGLPDQRLDHPGAA